MFFSVYTLGCKLNQLETEAITDSFCREGFTLIPWNTASPRPVEPWLMVINTCTVTSMAEQKARRFIRKLLREYPSMCVIITGCYAQLEQAALSALDPYDEQESSGYSRRLFVIPGESKDRLLDLPHSLAGTGMLQDDLPLLIAAWLTSLSPASGASIKEDDAFRLQPENFASRSRAFLKIQDGCDRRCAYCRVSIARGKSRSLAPEQALKTLKSLEERMFREAVIAGVNITQYHHSAGGEPAHVERAFGALAPVELTGLLAFLLSNTEIIRLRLSSIEPDWLTASRLTDFARVFANARIRPHIHLSAQSGSSKTLAKMGRSYAPEDIEKTAATLRSIREDPFLACDIIAGFPGESEKDFEETLSLCQRVGFAWIHAFPFSPRPGTAAYDFPERVSERDATRRVEQLTHLAQNGRRNYIARWEGREVEAIVEAGKTPRKHISAVSENYLKLLVACDGEPPAPGSLIRCRVSGEPPPAGSRFDARGIPIAEN